MSVSPINQLKALMGGQSPQDESERIHMLLVIDRELKSAERLLAQHEQDLAERTVIARLEGRPIPNFTYLRNRIDWYRQYTALCRDQIKWFEDRT